MTINGFNCCSDMTNMAKEREYPEQLFCCSDNQAVESHLSRREVSFSQMSFPHPSIFSDVGSTTFDSFDSPVVPPLRRTIVTDSQLLSKPRQFRIGSRLWIGAWPERRESHRETSTAHIMMHSGRYGGA
jgi:hypothetical protein